MLNSKRACPFEDDTSRPFKKRLTNIIGGIEVRDKINKPNPKEKPAVHIPIQKGILDKIKQNVNEAMKHLDKAFELGKVVEKKYTKEILSSIGLLKVFLKAAKASTSRTSSPPPVSPKVTIKREGSTGKHIAAPIQSKPMRPKMGFARKGQFWDYPQAKRDCGGGSFSRRSWLNPPPFSSFATSKQSTFLPPGSLNFRSRGWNQRERGSMRGRGGGGWGRGRGGTWQVRPKAPAKKYYCKVCNLECNSIEQYTSHNTGKSHKRKLKNIGLVPIQQAPKSVNKDQFDFHCDVCHIYCHGIEQWNAHQVGKKHKSKIRNATADQKGKYFCSICLMNCTAQAQWDSHLKGKTHAANLKATSK